MRSRDPTTDSQRLTDDQAELATYRQRLATVEAKLAKAETKEIRFYYETCAAGWRRSIAVLERRINDESVRSGTIAKT